MSMLMSLYRGATIALWPLAALYLSRRRTQGKEDPERFTERRGFAARRRPEGPLVWIHAASIGEALSVLSLIDRLLAERPALSILVTTGTVTSARLLADRLPSDRAWHQYVPVDHPAFVRRFLDHWHPNLAIWIESELWPNLISSARDRDIPLLLLNGRMSQRSFRGWQRWPALIRPLLQSFDLCLAQDQAQAQRFAGLGAVSVDSVGDLKSAAAPLPVDFQKLETMRQQVGTRPHWLAASTHHGEEAAAAAVHRQLALSRPDILTIIAPRHPARGDAIVSLLAAQGLTVARRSRTEPITTGTQIYLADTLGELGLFYRFADIAFIGGSLAPVGGHNPLEAALLDCAILYGPDMSNCAAIADTLARDGGAMEVADAAALAVAVAHLMDDRVLRDTTAAAAQRIANNNTVVLDSVMARLAPWLDRIALDAAIVT